jgi:hypothetical protein
MRTKRKAVILFFLALCILTISVNLKRRFLLLRPVFTDVAVAMISFAVIVDVDWMTGIAVGAGVADRWIGATILICCCCRDLEQSEFRELNRRNENRATKYQEITERSKELRKKRKNHHLSFAAEISS